MCTYVCRDRDRWRLHPARPHAQRLLCTTHLNPKADINTHESKMDGGQQYAADAQAGRAVRQDARRGTYKTCWSPLSPRSLYAPPYMCVSALFILKQALMIRVRGPKANAASPASPRALNAYVHEKRWLTLMPHANAETIRQRPNGASGVTRQLLGASKIGNAAVQRLDPGMDLARCAGLGSNACQSVVPCTCPGPGGADPIPQYEGWRKGG